MARRAPGESNRKSAKAPLRPAPAPPDFAGRDWHDLAYETRAIYRTVLSGEVAAVDTRSAEA